MISRWASNYGIAGVLLLLCIYYSVATVQDQQPTGSVAAALLMKQISESAVKSSSILILARESQDGRLFADELERELSAAGFSVAEKVVGGPREAKQVLEKLQNDFKSLELIATTQECADWPVLENVKPKILVPPTYRWPTFLKSENILNIANQMVVVAVIAIGMTLVILSGGIDLSVGSLVAVSAVVSTMLITRFAGAEQASGLAMFLSSFVGILICALLGMFSGFMVAVFRLPPFIATLGMMLVASGFAYIVSKGASIYEIPDSYTWLGRELGFFSIPNAVLLMIVLYTLAQIVMSRSTFGRYVYAVGGNREAARLSGVRVGWILTAIYTFSGAMAGLGGILMASQLKSGAPTYGTMYELYVIAAVVVGGTSLHGGEGTILGTLIGTLIITVIQNGMNLTNVESYTQKVVLGLVILGAVLLDMLKTRGWRQLWNTARLKT